MSAVADRLARRAHWFWLGAALLGVAVFLAVGLAMQGGHGAIAAPAAPTVCATGCSSAS